MTPEVSRGEELGGSDVEEYIITEKRSCDKLNHFLRSLHWQPNHIKHLKEVEEYAGNRPQNSDKR